MNHVFTHVPPNVRACIDELAQAATDPLSAFIYDLDVLRSHVQWLVDCLPQGVDLYYAIKANSEAPVLDALAPLVQGFEISSGGEIARVINCRERKPFIFSGPGKLDSDLRRALLSGVELIHIESLSEISRLERIASVVKISQPVLLRINPTLPPHLATKLSMAGAPTPFGIEEQQLADAMSLVERSPHLQLRGFHVHAMSHQLELERHQQLLNWYLDKWPEWCALAGRPQHLDCLNVGGGIGVDYQQQAQFDWPALCQWLAQALAKRTNAPRLRFELGRFVSAYCGYYVMQALDIKRCHGENFIVARGGTHQFRLPSAQSHSHPVIHLPQINPASAIDSEADIAGGNTTETYSIVGQLCTPKDVLARAVSLINPKVGDLLVLPLAGAYGFNISHVDFLCHPRPELHFLQGESRMSNPDFSHSIQDKEPSHGPELELAAD